MVTPSLLPSTDVMRPAMTSLLVSPRTIVSVFVPCASAAWTRQCQPTSWLASAVDDARSIAHIIQNSNSAPASNTLTLQQDDATVATTTMAASLNLTGEPKIKIGTDAKALGFYQYDGYWCAGILDGNLSGQAGDGSLAHRKTVVGITAALDLSALSIAAA